MKETKITFSHGMIAMFLEMSAIDGQMDLIEFQTIGDLVREHLGHLKHLKDDNDALELLFEESHTWWSGFPDRDSRIQEIIQIAVRMRAILSKEERVLIANSLAIIANSDGEVHDNEKLIYKLFLDCLDLTSEDILG